MKVQERILIGKSWSLWMNTKCQVFSSTSKDAMVTLPIHVHGGFEGKERNRFRLSFCFRRCVIIRGWFAICRVTLYHAKGVSLRSARFSMIIRAYAAILHDQSRSGIIATLVISNLSSFRTCYSLILRGGTRVLFHEKFQRVRIANRVYKISLSRNSC